jgi:hypothetical protein
LLAKLEVEVLWREFSWFKDMGQEGCPTDFGLFVRMLGSGVDCFLLYQGFFSKKVALLSVCLQQTHLVCYTDQNFLFI